MASYNLVHFILFALTISTALFGSYECYEDGSRTSSHTQINKAQFEDSNTPAPATKVINNVSVSTSDIQIDPSRTLWFRLFTPKINSGKPLPLVVYFHGGGFNQFGPNTKAYDDLCSNLAAKAPAVIVSVNYRLAPQKKYPTQYQDSYDALKFIDTHTSVLPSNTDFTHIFIGGDSTGANIIHHVTVKALKNRQEFNKIRIIGVLSLQPFFGGEERTKSELRLPRDPFFNVDSSDKCWRDFLPVGANRDHPAAHVFGGGANSVYGEELKKLEFPPILVVRGENDLLLDWQNKYVEWLKDCGKEVELAFYQKTGHGFYLYSEFPKTSVFYPQAFVTQLNLMPEQNNVITALLCAHC